MYKIEHNHQHGVPVINGKEFDLATIGSFHEITPLEFAKSISRTTGSNAEIKVQYTQDISWFVLEHDDYSRRVETKLSDKYEGQYHGEYWIWADGFILFSLRSYYGTGPVFFKASVCDHEYVEHQLSRCYTRTECKKCNYSYTTDSSD